MLAEGIQTNGGLARVVIYPNFRHAIPSEIRGREAESFIPTYLK